MEFHRFYHLSYAKARSAFLSACAQAGVEVHSLAHPEACGPAQTPLHCDVAVFGRADAPRRLMIISATHGLEGFCGSAAQLAWIGSEAWRQLPADVAIVMVHAINPWGFAQLSRTTENNVDLNRNFIDFSQPVPANPRYADLHTVLLGPEWTAASRAAAQQAMTDFAAEHGEDALFDTLARGQYTHAQGLNYGGRAREWSNHALEQIVRTHMGGAERAGLIDWHTGIGEYGAPFFLCFNAPGSDAHAQAIQWWGAQAIEGQQPHGRARPQYQGLLFHGVERWLGDTPMCGAVIEFGTRGWHMRRLLRLDLWLKFHATPDTDRYRMHQADLLDAFCPVDELWRQSTVDHAYRITDEAIRGLARW